MIKNKHTRKTIAIFFLLNFLSTLFPYSTLYANNNGPNAPEAAAFEPVDATDMVNLSSGDFSYVLPLLNIPSPEGGYPLALAYHAGIAMDQEASWIGLGWNLNPGAINRSVNGAPDDYNASQVTQFFWDKTQTITEYSASVGWGVPGMSVGLGLSWGSHKSLGGHVSIGISIPAGDGNAGLNVRVGTGGASIGIGYSTPSGLNFGMSLNSDGKVSGDLGFDKNGTGFSISTNGSFGVSLGNESKSGALNSLDLSFSSSGVGISVSSRRGSKEYTNPFSGQKLAQNARNKTGVGANISFTTTASMGDYSTSTSGWSIPLFIPIGLGFLSFSFGKTEYKFSLHKFEKRYVDGPMHFYDGIGTVDKWGVHSNTFEGNHPRDGGPRLIKKVVFTTVVQQEALDYISQRPQHNLTLFKYKRNESYMDVLELPVNSGDFSGEEDKLLANPNFPNYDKFNVQAQGLSGAITARLFENKALFGISGQKDVAGNDLDYVVNHENVPTKFRFTQKPFFYFENEISTYLETPKAKLEYSDNILNSFKNYQYSNDNLNPNNRAENVRRRKTGNHIEYYTNKEILEQESRLLSEGFVKPNVTGLNRDDMPEEGIGAFKITSIDGKTYHYSLPVYNHEIIQRTYGMKKDFGTNTPREENESHFEKRQLEPYATHWLLTAITGPDYVDKDNNGKVDNDDYGYWVNFDYGKYSDAFIWTSSYGKDVIVNPNSKDIKTWVKGRKDQYYLDRIATRTHSAVFIKSKRKDAKSIPFIYNYAVNKDSYSSSPAFSVPSQYPLKLDKIILVKGKDRIDKTSGSQNDYRKITIDYPKEGGETVPSEINIASNVIDVTDDFSSLKSRIVKSIEFNNNHYNLVRGTPNSDSGGRLTLNGVEFKGKNETSVIPPYEFNYINPSYNFNIEDKDNFGYYKTNNSIWSLNEIITPEGGKVQVEYEKHRLISAIPHKFKYQSTSNLFKIQYLRTEDGKFIFSFKSDDDTGLNVGEKLDVEYGKVRVCTLTARDTWSDVIINFKGKVEIINDKGNNEFIGKSIDYGTINTPSSCPGVVSNIVTRSSAEYVSSPKSIFNLGGIRTKKVSTLSEDGKLYSMNYIYGENGDGIGHVTYLPYAPELTTELPYSSELPPAKPMYEYVATSTSIKNSLEDDAIEYGLKTEYKFNVLKEKEEGKAKFGNFYEIESNDIYGSNSSSTQLKSYTIKDNLATMGQLLGVKTYNQKGQLLNSLKNTYYGPDETPDKIGITQESYQTYKKVTNSNNEVKNLGVSSTRITYPAMIKNSTELKAGESYTSEFNDLDPITGQARETYSYSSTGIKIKTKGIQAFRKYSKMGSKVDNITNKNMLTQSAGQYTYIFKDNDWKEIGVGITTWNNIWDYQFNNRSTGATSEIWRKHKSYIWKGAKNNDGTFDSSNQFNWAIGATQNNNWQKTSETTRYNQFSNPLEVKDINNNYASSKMGDNYSKVIATANANYDEIHYSGAEYLASENSAYFDGGIKSLGYKRVVDAHTGTHVVEVNTGQSAFETNIPRRDDRTGIKQRFKVSVWVRIGQETKTKIKVNGSSSISFNANENVQAGNWVLLNGYVTIPVGGATIAITSSGGLIQLDDFRIHPITSSMTSYVYNKWDEVSYITGSNGLSTHYIYDAAGRLKETQVEVITNIPAGINGGFEKVSTNSYNYKRNQ